MLERHSVQILGKNEFKLISVITNDSPQKLSDLFSFQDFHTLCTFWPNSILSIPRWNPV